MQAAESQSMNVAQGRSAAGTPCARVVIAEDHPIMREGLIDLLSLEPSVQYAGWADSAAGVLRILSRVQPEILVLDLTLGADDGVELAMQLRRDWRDLRIVVLSMHDERVIEDRLLSAGVFAYVTKDRTRTEFLTALRQSVLGKPYITAEQQKRLAARQAAPTHVSPESILSARELAVLQGLADGKTSETIAAELSMAPKTVYSHRRNIGSKLGIATGRDMIRYAVYWARRAHRTVT